MECTDTQIFQRHPALLILHTLHLDVTLCLDLRCVVKDTFCGKPILQYSHMKGLSFVCCLVCIFSAYGLVNPFLQNVQPYGRSPVWVCVCFFRSRTRFPHNVHITFLASGSERKYINISVYKRH